MNQRMHVKGLTPLGKKWYESEVCLPGTRGTVRRRKKFKAADYRAAMVIHAAFRAEVLALGGGRGDWTIRTYVAHYEAALTGRMRGGSATTFAADVARLVAVFGEKPLGQIHAAAVRDAIVAWQRDGYAAGTIRRTGASLRKILRDAVDRQELVLYPIRGKLPWPKEERLALEMSPAEAARLIAAFDDRAGFLRNLSREQVSPLLRPHDGAPVPEDARRAGALYDLFRWSRPLFVVAVETGLSRGDLLGLTWAEVDEAAGLIRTARQKTGVPATPGITAACAAALQELRAREILSPLVFTDAAGHPVSVMTVRRHFERAKSIAGIDRRLRFHDLRHTCGSRLASEGVSLQVIARWLGHASIRMSERYARPDDEAIRKAAKRQHENGANSPTNSLSGTDLKSGGKLQ